MKLRVLCGFVGAMAVGHLLAEDSGASQNVRINVDSAAPKSATPTAPGKAAPSASKSSGTTSTSTATSEKAKKNEPPAKIDGMPVSRGDKGYLGVKIVDNQFRIGFYDTKKKPKTADVAHIALRWPVQYQPNPERAYLSPVGDGKVMSAEKTVRAPFSFKLFITLISADNVGTETADETYVLDFSQ